MSKSEKMQAIRSEGPGPGAYESEDAHTGPQYSMGGRGGLSSYESNPGPGSYNASASRGGTLYSIGGRQSDYPGDMPGPGQYELPKDIPPPAWSFGSKHEEKKDSNPGPGQYSPQDSQRSSPGTLISQLERNYAEQTDSPGPGAYNTEIKSSTSVKYSFGKAERSKETEEVDSRMTTIPASIPNAPKYLLPHHILEKYNSEN